jgi:hypothetical protein
VLGFVAKTDVPLGEHRWLTVVSPDDPDGTELLLEPDALPEQEHLLRPGWVRAGHGPAPYPPSQSCLETP